MRIGIPKEIKVHEYRVGMVPAGVRELVVAGHEVVIESNAGAGAGFDDDAYRSVGAEVLETAGAVFENAELIIKVKEPQLSECQFLRSGQTLFTYLHLAAEQALTEALLAANVTAIAYETVTDANGSLPLLTPMSEVAGRMSVQVGAMCLQKFYGGSGVLLGGVPGVLPGRVLILGGGVAGTNAAEMAVGLRAEVTILDKSVPRLRELSARFGARVNTAFSTLEVIEQLIRDADLVVGSVLVAGARAPRLVTRDMLGTMKKGSVLVDIAIDQGGCFESSRPTTHAEPTFIEEGVVHYCVTNMPGAVAHTSTLALTNATLPYIQALAGKGIKKALDDDVGLRAGLNVEGGAIRHQVLAESLAMEYRPFAFV